MKHGGKALVYGFQYLYSLHVGEPAGRQAMHTIITSFDTKWEATATATATAEKAPSVGCNFIFSSIDFTSCFCPGLCWPRNMDFCPRPDGLKHASNPNKLQHILHTSHSFLVFEHTAQKKYLAGGFLPGVELVSYHGTT